MRECKVVLKLVGETIYLEAFGAGQINLPAAES